MSKVFDVDNDRLQIGGFDIVDFTTGDPVTFSKTADNVQVVETAYGEPIVLKKHHGLGTVTVRVLPDTPSFKHLMKLANTTEETDVIINMQGEKISGTRAFFAKTPNGTISENAPVREFTLHVLDYKHDALD